MDMDLLIYENSKEIELQYGSTTISVGISFARRKSLAITVHPDMKVTARVPLELSIDEVKHFLKKRAPWIVKQLNYFEQFQPMPPERRYVSGETHYYLGRQYRLRIRCGEKANVRLIGRFFEMELPDPDDRDEAKRLMLNWYSAHAKNLLTRRMAIYLPTFVKMGAAEPKVRYRRMKRRWGSCSTKGVIILNTELVKAPVHCVDYVIIHELCHLIHPHHDKNFYHLLGRVLPDWEKRKQRLEKVIIW